MTKQFATGQFFGKRPAINSNEWFAFTFATLMYLLRNGFFTAAAFAMYNNRIVSGCNKIYLLYQLLEHCRVTKNIVT